MVPLRLLILAGLLWVAWHLLRNLIRERNRQGGAEQGRGPVEDVLMEDPVCHALIPKRQAVRLHQDGKNYYFCSDVCCEQFIGRSQGDSE